jgi:L-rhamnose mutarotase
MTLSVNMLDNNILDMKRALFAILAGVAVATFAMSLSSCAPQAFTMNIEMRHPSKSGLDLSRKSMSVVYLEDGGKLDSAFNNAMSDGFAQKLESDYFRGKEVIDVLKMPKVGNGNYSSRDTLLNLIMDSGNDVVFLIDVPEFGQADISEPEKNSSATANPDSAYHSTCSLPFNTKIYVYDSMHKADTVLSFKGSNVIHPVIYGNGKEDASRLKEDVWKFVGPAAEDIGAKAASSFLSTWKAEQYSVIYYDNLEDAWTDAADYANNFKWKEALEKWMTLVNTNNVQKRSCAEYDMALGCYMLGQLDLATKWLDRSDKDYPLSLSKGLRKRIAERLK